MRGDDVILGVANPRSLHGSVSQTLARHWAATVVGNRKVLGGSDWQSASSCSTEHAIAWPKGYSS
jgi:hypothetical protein